MVRWTQPGRARPGASSAVCQVRARCAAAWPVGLSQGRLCQARARQFVRLAPVACRHGAPNN
eukprot:3216332-Alexandrium_andersonii.AAC.1